MKILGTPMLIGFLLAGCRVESVSSYGSDPGADGTEQEEGNSDAIAEFLHLGAPCESDDDCGEGLFCLLEPGNDWGGGAVPGGVCVASCTDHAGICDELGEAVCIRNASLEAETSEDAYCMPKCELGRSGEGEGECRVHPHAACDELDGDDGFGFCRPFCALDEDCEKGRCDRRLGSCVTDSEPTSGEAFGEPCDPESPSCNGVCVVLGDEEVAFCSYRCVVGELTPCETSEDGAPLGICTISSRSGSTGDLGYCNPLCNCDDDCAHPGFVCKPWENAELASEYTAEGYCAPGERPGVECS